MDVIIAGGTGFVGRHLVAGLIRSGMNVSVVGRDKAKITGLFSDKVEALHWDDLNEKMLCAYDVIINLAGKNISERRWNEKIKEEIISSRVNATCRLALLCAQLGVASPRLLNASAVSIYGRTNDDPSQPIPVDEDWPIIFKKKSGFLTNVAWQWERALDVASDNNVSVTVMRFGLVFKLNEGMLGKLAPIVKLGLAGKLGDGQQWLSWIHVDDLVLAIIFLIDHPVITGSINLTHVVPVTQSDFIHTLANHYHRPCFFNMPAWCVKFLLGEMGEELLLSGQKVIPTRLINHGFRFTKQTLSDAFT